MAGVRIYESKVHRGESGGTVRSTVAVTVRFIVAGVRTYGVRFTEEAEEGTAFWQESGHRRVRFTEEGQEALLSSVWQQSGDMRVKVHRGGSGRQC